MDMRTAEGEKDSGVDGRVVRRHGGLALLRETLDSLSSEESWKLCERGESRECVISLAIEHCQYPLCNSGGKDLQPSATTGALCNCEAQGFVLDMYCNMLSCWSANLLDNAWH